MPAPEISYTAAFIAIKFYGLTRYEAFRSLFDEEVVLFYERLVQEFPLKLKFYYPLLKSKIARNLFMKAEDLLLPGDLMHILMRKYYINQLLKDAHQKGINQLVVLGAGFDHTSIMASQTGMQCFEVDAVTPGHIKSRLINKYDYQNDSLHIIEADLISKSVTDLLHNHPNFDNRAGTFIIAEGFFDYLQPLKVKKIIDEISHVSSGEVHLASTIFALDELTPFYRFVFTGSIRLVGEKIRFVTQPGFLTALLEWNDFHIDALIDYEQMRKEMLFTRNIKNPMLRGFYILKAIAHGKNES